MSRRGWAAALLGRREITSARCSAIDGPIAPLPCLSKIAYRRCADCSDEGTCEVRHVFARVAVATREVLDSTTLADAVNGSAPVL